MINGLKEVRFYVYVDFLFHDDENDQIKKVTSVLTREFLEDYKGDAIDISLKEITEIVKSESVKFLQIEKEVL